MIHYMPISFQTCGVSVLSEEQNLTTQQMSSCRMYQQYVVTIFDA